MNCKSKWMVYFLAIALGIIFAVSVNNRSSKNYTELQILTRSGRIDNLERMISTSDNQMAKYADNSGNRIHYLVVNADEMCCEIGIIDFKSPRGLKRVYYGISLSENFYYFFDPNSLEEIVIDKWWSFGTPTHDKLLKKLASYF